MPPGWHILYQYTLLYEAVISHMHSCAHERIAYSRRWSDLLRESLLFVSELFQSRELLLKPSNSLILSFLSLPRLLRIRHSSASSYCKSMLSTRIYHKLTLYISSFQQFLRFLRLFDSHDSIIVANRDR